MKSIVYALVVLICFYQIGCATIIRGVGHENVTISYPMPLPQLIRVANLYTGRDTIYTTSSQMTTIGLERNCKFFKRSSYRVYVSRSGLSTDSLDISPRISPLFWINIPVGVIWILVDAQTGAMYQFPSSININNAHD